MKIAILVATGFEDTELISAIDVFSRESIAYDLISVENLKQVKGQNQAIVETIDFMRDFDDYDAVFLPGGKGHKLLLNDQKVLDILVQFREENKWIFAICAAPDVLVKANVLEGKKYTSFPGYASSKNNTGNDVEIDGKIITGRDYISTIKFAKEITKRVV